ncbi:MAG: response regulator [Deltaproteobacteria bacterium]|nr:response regulator [Deltaproteobacteria bacterium]
MNEVEEKVKTVRVPDEFVDLFARAEKIVSSYFGQRRDDPERGAIEISGERYLLVRAASMSVEFFSLVRDLYGLEKEDEADDFARNLLFDLAHAIGRSDARRFHERMNLENPIERLAAGPVHFSHTGWAFVEILPESRPAPDESYYLIYNHPSSFEADAWVADGREVDFPVCIMNSGYSSGWCQESYGVRLVSSELLCRARGDETCRFIMAHPERIEGFLERYIKDAPHLARRIHGYQIPDFFARKRMEEELRQARDEMERRVEERTAELEHANELLRQEMTARKQAESLLLQTAKLEAVGRLAGGIAHDFNNLMGVVIGHASLLENRLQSDNPTMGHISKIRQAGEEASQLTQQLLAFSRAQLPNLELVDLNEVISDTTYMLERLIGENVELQVELGSDVGNIFADSGQLRQVVMNLVVNARDAMPVGGTLSIDTKRIDQDECSHDKEHDVSAGAWSLLSVSDSGVGMDKETQEKAFDPFFTTKELGAGTGLGLSTVYRIVTQFSGSISVTTAPGEGTTFKIYLPRTDFIVDNRHTSQGAQWAGGGSETILVVEDQNAVRQMVVGILEDLGYEVMEAENSERALQLAASYSNDIHLLLTDVVMPRMSGRNLADRLMEVRPETKVLFMSGYADEEVLRWGVQQGTVELIAKPFTSQALAERIRKILDG